MDFFANLGVDRTENEKDQPGLPQSMQEQEKQSQTQQKRR